MPHEPTSARHGSRLQLILRNLPHLLAARDAGSLHRAGDRMGIAQSALSRRIAEVEAELGGPLFERLSTGIRCTSAGADFLTDAAHLMAGLDRAIRRFELNRADEDMTLRIGFNSAAMMFPAMASALSGFRRTHPRCDLRLAAHLTEAQYILIHKGEIDIGVAYLLRNDLPLQHRILAEDRIVLALPADHPLALWDVLPNGSDPLRRLIKTLGVDRCGAISGSCALCRSSSESEWPLSPIAADAMPQPPRPLSAREAAWGDSDIFLVPSTCRIIRSQGGAGGQEVTPCPPTIFL
ncbi:LysR family transcriptional regulator [Paracoccus sp. FO-3]|uniref:LysR family transcriptional regulator n=1 Tax=Paracoccus sp. FO-3 TaxID=1335059 RepID=UPI0015E4514A|nr:LysR family transcriptional regulator [Paracoccus sp. FO-3]